MNYEYINLIEKINEDYLKLNGFKKGIIKCNDSFLFRIKRKINLMNIPDKPLYNYNFTEEQKKKMKNSESNKRVVIYTAIIGDYDDILEPLYYFNKNVDYVLFTNNENIKSEKWKIKKIPSNILKFENGTLINRYLKFHPQELFKNQYDYSIYVDGNILIVSDLYPLIFLINKSYGLGMHSHFARDCVYDEAKVCIYNKKGNKNFILKLLNDYKMENFPKHFGLLEAPIIVSNLYNTFSKKILNETYELLITSKTLRDQLCLPFVLWKNEISVSDIATLGKNIYLNPKVRSISHK